MRRVYCLTNRPKANAYFVFALGTALCVATAGCDAPGCPEGFTLKGEYCRKLATDESNASNAAKPDAASVTPPGASSAVGGHSDVSNGGGGGLGSGAAGPVRSGGSGEASASTTDAGSGGLAMPTDAGSDGTVEAGNTAMDAGPSSTPAADAATNAANTVGSDATMPSCGDESAKCKICGQSYPCRTTGADYVCVGQLVDWSPAYSATAFKDNGDGTVIDSRTGLTWQRTLPTTYAGCTGTLSDGTGKAGEACTWAEAKEHYCPALTLAGAGGWRLPTKAELESLVDDTRVTPAIDPTAFPATASSGFWTSSTYVGASGRAWYVQFTDGYAGGADLVTAYRVRCVRS